ncbi:2TM domain-containing protein [Christiangramia sabulilitoris]|uniref:2TM domain-containing protein n=1 Tax=Christiangramia sabulilitoris TaxID=2583991 RepID=A0A550I6W6_9FLAO|nr:2TM domain-containing protein [Christiangramia sabulilitoris]TRO66715.1 2TM domain-containing protein [Christiangramia sabulilitoris]
METNYKEKLSYRTAQKRVKDMKDFYIHLTVYLFINTAIFIVITRDVGIIRGLTDLSNYSTIFFWGIGLFAHWASVFGPNLILGKKWEEKKIKEIMEKDKRQIWK